MTWLIKSVRIWCVMLTDRNWPHLWA